MTNKALFHKLRESLGFFNENDVPAMIEEFGSEYEIVVRYHTRARQVITLQMLTELPDNLMLDIRDVFILAAEYDRLFGKPTITMAGRLIHQEAVISG